MIKISYYRAKHRVTIKGHAMSGEPGQDLICGAVTTLVRTLAKNCVNAEQDKRMRDVNIRLDKGDSEISAVPCKKLDSVITLVFDTVCVGFEILAHQFPEYVAFQVL